jgi:tetratricopeptide (TPR) repeat protein
MRSVVLVSVLLLASVACKKNKPEDQSHSDCKQFINQGVDSLAHYQHQFKKRRSTLEASLKLYNDAIKCDSNLNVARWNKLGVFGQLEEYDSIIVIVDDLLKRHYDSSILIFKAGAYEKLKNMESSQLMYRRAYGYLVRKLKYNPDNASLIYHKVFAMSKIFKEDSALKEIDYYLAKYPNDRNLKAILTDTVTLKFLKQRK